MSFPSLLLSNPPSLSKPLKWKTDQLLSQIVRANYNTQFAQTVAELADFRHVMGSHISGMADDALCESFRKTVRLVTYDSYAPFVARFLEKPCKAGAVVDLLAPGLPDCLVRSSSTSGGLPKIFPKYNCTSTFKSSDAGPPGIPDPLRKRTTAHMCYLGWKRMDVEHEDNSPASTIYWTCNSNVALRMRMNLDPDKDEERMGTFILDHAAPFSAGFVEKWRPFLLIHALFALASRSLETMYMLFITTFTDMMHYLDMEFDTMVDCIANGTIPNLDGIAHVRHHLELNIIPDPERAAELRKIGRPSSQQGWCGLVWPNLRSVVAIASGSFASSIPMARRFLGPNADIQPHGYGSTEAWIGSPYDPRDLNMFRPNDKVIFEFLDVSKSDSIDCLAQPWEVEPGRRYELVLTTQDGLWRYRLGDIVEVSGFDPIDGVPIIQFVERRNMAIRLPYFMITEKELKSAILSMQINTVNWTAMIDDRHVPSTIGFFVELAEDQVPSGDLELAPERANDQLSRSNVNITWALADGLFRKPTVWLVRPGTFSDFLQLKLDEGSNNVGQLKVPSVVPKGVYVTWFLNQVVREL